MITAGCARKLKPWRNSKRPSQIRQHVIGSARTSGAGVCEAACLWTEDQGFRRALHEACMARGLSTTATGDSEWMASDMAADFGHSRRGRTLQGANRASSLFVLVAVGSVVAPENTVMISASVSARARSHQGLLYISSDDPFS